MFHYETFFLFQICSLFDRSKQIPEKKVGGHRALLREKEHIFRYRAKFECNLLRFVRARAHVRALMTRKSCAVGMRNAILRNYLKNRQVLQMNSTMHKVTILTMFKIQMSKKLHYILIKYECECHMPYGSIMNSN